MNHARIAVAMTTWLACGSGHGAEPSAASSGAATTGVAVLPSPDAAQHATSAPSLIPTGAIVYSRDGRDVRPTHALAEIGPNDLTIFVSTMPLTCRALHDNALMATDGIAILLPIGPKRDYYRGTRVGVPVWSLGDGPTFALAPPFVGLEVTSFDPKALRIAGGVQFDGRAHAIGAKNDTRQIAGGGRFEAAICDPFKAAEAPPTAPSLHTDAFAGRVAGQPFALAHAFAIVCGAPGARFVARIELSADPAATCTSFWNGHHAELDTIGGSGERAPLLHVPQPADSNVGDGMGAESRPGTASVTWEHLELDVGGTVTGTAQVDSLDGKARDGGLWTDASGTFTARVCADQFKICAVSGG